MLYMFSVSTLNDDGTMTIPADKVERWKRQIQTLYDDLSPQEKKSDDEIAEEYITIIDADEYVSPKGMANIAKTIEAKYGIKIW